MYAQILTYALLLALCLLLPQASAHTAWASRPRETLLHHLDTRHGRGPDPEHLGAWHSSKAYKEELHECIKYLTRCLPKADRGRITQAELALNAGEALAARYATPWAAAVPWDVFLNEVLPYASLDEPRDFMLSRPMFMGLLLPWMTGGSQTSHTAQKLASIAPSSSSSSAAAVTEGHGLLEGLVGRAHPRAGTSATGSISAIAATEVANCRKLKRQAHTVQSMRPVPQSITEAAQLLNRDLWEMWGIHFVPDQTPEIMSPSQVIAAGYASCTGLSIFLVAACRAVGIPARVAGTPSWLQAPQRPVDAGSHVQTLGHDYHNHNWVEVWDNGTWSWLGAAEYDVRGLNRTWFFPQPAKGQTPGSRMHAIYAASYAPTGEAAHTKFPLVWNLGWMQPAVDVTQVYLGASEPA